MGGLYLPRRFAQRSHITTAEKKAISRREHHGDPRFDSHGRPRGENRDGLAYSICPMCSKRSMVRYPGSRRYDCEACGYADSEDGEVFT